MSSSFQSFSPVVFTLDYDWLLAKEGCEEESGFNAYKWLAFDRICISEHDTDSIAFNQPDTLSYCLGPSTPGSSEHPFRTLWTAWVGKNGIQIGKVGAITPPSSPGVGNTSNLYPATKPTKLSHAFNAKGLLAIAIQKDESTIEIKRYIDEYDNTATVTFEGVSALMFYTGLLDTADPDDSGLACFYLKPEMPYMMFARFGHDGFSTERVVMPDLRAAPVRLVSTFTRERRQYLLFIDKLGRDITLRSPEYAVDISEASTLEASFSGGIIFKQALRKETTKDRSTLSASFDSGYMFNTSKPPSTMPGKESSTLSAKFEDGEVLKVTP